MKILRKTLGIILLLMVAPIIFWMAKGFDPDFLLEAIIAGITVDFVVCVLAAFIVLGIWLFFVDDK